MPSDLEGFKPQVVEGGAIRSLQVPFLVNLIKPFAFTIPFFYFQKTELAKEEMIDLKMPLGEEEEAFTHPALSGAYDTSSHIETPASVGLTEESFMVLPYVKLSLPIIFV